MQLTKYAIELMGFQPIPQGQLIVGVFFSIHVYEVRGFTVEADALSWHSECVRGDSCQVAFGSSVNEICKKLASDSFTDNEAEWQEIHKCTPPYLVIILGPTQEYQASGTYFKTHEQTIETYDCFRAAKNELESKQYSTLPSLLSALACSFDISDYPIQFLPIDRAVYGKSGDGTTIIDTRVFDSASGYVSKHLEGSEIESRLNCVHFGNRSLAVRAPSAV